MRFETFLAEIHTELSSFSPDIDDISVKTWVMQELKRFGMDILPLHEKIVDIRNSQGDLPETFRALKLALKLEPFCRTINGNPDDFNDSFIYKARIEHPAYFNEVTHEYITNCNTKIVEDVITIGNSQASFYYHSPTFLSLSKNIKKDGLASTCLNLQSQIRNSSPFEISITGHTIHTNFGEGSIYVQFYALETDEDGEIIIPETRTGALVKYLEYYVKARIAEKLIANNQNPQGLTQLMQLYMEEKRKNLIIASYDARFSGEGDWAQNFKILNQRDMVRFNLS